MKFYREVGTELGTTITSCLKWYEGVIFIDHARLIIHVAIMPFNILLRWARRIWFYVKVGN